MKVPFLDLKAQYMGIQQEIEEAIGKVLASCAFAGGPFVEQFERDFASFCGCDYAVGVGNGTDALWLSLLALGIGPGDEVVTVPNTFIATAEAISFCGAKPVFVDIDGKTYTMDPEKLRHYLSSQNRKSKIENHIKAIIPVHLYGQMADMDPIMEIARDYGLFVIEDACQAHGAQYKGRPAGSIGDAGCFSFYPGKNLGAYGEAGAIVTKNQELERKIRTLRDHGQLKKYYHQMIGWNARMDGIQGAVLKVKLQYLTEWNETRVKNALLYDDLLSKIEGIVIPERSGYGNHVFHIYAIRNKRRDDLIGFLKSRDVHCGIHYPIPIHLQKAYHSLGLKKGSFPVSEKCADELLSLPMYPELTEGQVTHVCNQIKEFVEQN